MKHGNTMTAILFLSLLCMGFGLMIVAFLAGGSLRTVSGEVRRDPILIPAFLDGGAETAANKDLSQVHVFIQAYGLFQRLSGRRVIEDLGQSAAVAKLNNGTLNFIDLSNKEVDLDRHVLNTERLDRALGKEGIPYLFVLAPQKIEPGTDPLPDGLHDRANGRADAFLSALGDRGTDTLDLRPLFMETDDYASWFFRTDHHWRPEAAFYAWGALTEVLEESYGLDVGGEYTDEANWDISILNGWFLGSQGKRVGSLYAGVDDFTIYTPKFKTDLTYTCPSQAIDRSGSLNESVCFPERTEQKDWFGGNPYTYYAGGDYPIATIVDHSNPDGPKLLLIRDSFACAITPFLALSCSELTTVDLRYLEQDLLETIQQIDPDLVLTLYTVGTVGNANMFDFFDEGYRS